MSYRFGDVVIVSFPFTSAAVAKRRPAVVVSAAAMNDGLLDVILLPITSRLLPIGAIPQLVLQDWRSAGLLKPSAVKPNFFTFLQSQVVRTLGTLSNADVASLRTFATALIG